MTVHMELSLTVVEKEDDEDDRMKRRRDRRSRSFSREPDKGIPEHMSKWCRKGHSRIGNSDRGFPECIENWLTKERYKGIPEHISGCDNCIPEPDKGIPEYTNDTIFSIELI